jgi:hypothetical protein
MKTTRPFVLLGTPADRQSESRNSVTQEEAEDVFFNEPLVVRGDRRHSPGTSRG